MRFKWKLILTVIIILVASTFAILLYNGIIWFNNPSDIDYPVRGVDVSAYQGEIDWDILSNQNIDFAFIKATEGSSFKDKYFDSNWEDAGKTNLYIGAYHFFSYDSPGEEQAENFIQNVSVKDKMLPPVVDIEFYADKEINLPDKDTTVKSLQILLDKLGERYGVKPIIYATMKSYKLYIEDEFQEYPVWIRNILQKPRLEDNREWTFWQYSDRGMLDGYNGEEKFIDMNVYYGSKEEFLEYVGLK